MKIISYLIGYLKYKITQNFPKTINLCITYACNSKCSTCNIWKYYKERPTLFKRELTFKDYKSIFTKLKNVSYIYFTGGEPTLKKDFEKIISFVLTKTSVKIVRMFTNGISSKFIFNKIKKIVEFIPKGKNFYVFISLDGTPSVHDYLRGVNNNFENAVSLFIRLRKLTKKFKGLKVYLVYTISNFNVGRFEEFYNYMRVNYSLSLKDIFLSVASYSPYYRVDFNPSELSHDYIENVKRDINFWLSQFKKLNLKDRISLDFHLFCIHLILPYLLCRNPHPFLSDVKKDLIIIDPFGNVYNHLTLRKKYGNIKMDSLRKIKKRILIERRKIKEIYDYYCAIYEAGYQFTLDQIKYILKSILLPL
jgi:MoaA/NifB/PqqE/SkfB family radical SAM enzyme